MTIDTDKILPVDVLKYCEGVDKSLSDYEMRGIHHDKRYDSRDEGDSIRDFAHKVPDNAEIVANYQFQITPIANGDDIWYFATGLALILKDNKDRQDDGKDNNLLHPDDDQDRDD